MNCTNQIVIPKPDENTCSIHCEITVSLVGFKPTTLWLQVLQLHSDFLNLNTKSSEPFCHSQAQVVQVGGSGQVMSSGQPITIQLAGGQGGTVQLQQVGQMLQVTGQNGQVQQVSCWSQGLSRFWTAMRCG